jgi:transcriptional regulator GlxA family with amidase domain
MESAEPSAQGTVRLELEARLRRLALETRAPSAKAARAPADPGIERALAFLNQHYRRAILSSEVAAAAGWHEKYLMRAFKRTTQMSMGEYLMRLRVAHAQWLLISSDKSMLEIAFESGFQSVAPFYQAFRRVSPEATPLQFRKNALGAGL